MKLKLISISRCPSCEASPTRDVVEHRGNRVLGEPRWGDQYTELRVFACGYTLEAANSEVVERAPCANGFAGSEFAPTMDIGG